MPIRGNSPQDDPQQRTKPLLEPIPPADPWAVGGEVRFSKEEVQQVKGGRGGRVGFGNNGIVVWRGLRMAKQQMAEKGQKISSGEKAAENLAKLLAGLTGFLAGSFASGSIYFIDRQRQRAKLGMKRPPPITGRYGLIGAMAAVGLGIGYQVGSMRFGYIFTTMSRPDSNLLHSFRRSVATISPHHPLLGIRVSMPDNEESHQKILAAVRNNTPLILNDLDAERYEKFKMEQEEKGLLSPEEEKRREKEREDRRRYEEHMKEVQKRQEIKEAEMEQKGEDGRKEAEEKRRKEEGVRQKRARARAEREKEREIVLSREETMMEEKKEEKKEEGKERRMRKSRMKMEREKEQVRKRVENSWDH